VKSLDLTAEWPAELVARPCPDPAPQWHLVSLDRLLEQGASDRVSAIRAAYHARWLSHLLAPEDPARVPGISVVIPVYNRAEMAADAVASALGQKYPRVEVIVVDDGSTDELEEALRPVRDRILFRRQPNRGVSSARNQGIRLATGEFLQFLDSDNQLDPDACDRWIRAFRCVPDGELCFAHPRAVGEEELLQIYHQRPRPSGELGCPTSDLLHATSRTNPFLNVGTLIPRWVVEATGPFDETLRRGEDTRYWFQLGLRGTKALGLREPMNTRTLLRTGLTFSAETRSSASALLNLLDLLRRPWVWKYVGGCLARLRFQNRWSAIDSISDPRVHELLSAVLEEFIELSGGERRDGLCPLPVLRVCRAQVVMLTKRGNVVSAPGSFYAELLAIIEQGIECAPPPDGRDFEYWLAKLGDRRNRSAERFLLRELDQSVRRGTPPVSFAELGRLAPHAPDPTARKLWKALGALAPAIGERPTGYLLKCLRVGARAVHRGTRLVRGERAPG
jgi:hypothetical protein